MSRGFSRSIDYPEIVVHRFVGFGNSISICDETILYGTDHLGMSLRSLANVASLITRGVNASWIRNLTERRLDRRARG